MRPIPANASATAAGIAGRHPRRARSIHALLVAMVAGGALGLPHLPVAQAMKGDFSRAEPPARTASSPAGPTPTPYPNTGVTPTLPAVPPLPAMPQRPGTGGPAAIPGTAPLAPALPAAPVPPVALECDVGWGGHPNVRKIIAINRSSIAIPAGSEIQWRAHRFKLTPQGKSTPVKIGGSHKLATQLSTGRSVVVDDDVSISVGQVLGDCEITAHRVAAGALRP